ncbi:MAG: hypothetical protein F4057_09030 [Acidobacteria bacterium]|nr:hypothetical protein [Acidobacteriota bacterium]MYI75440.1 hypothetical protein [Acidobacteriota bacterium]
MHDLAEFEARGIPAVMVASSEFVDAARRQSAALGMPAIAERAVYVAHPIQDATDEELRAKARAAIDAILSAITS